MLWLITTLKLLTEVALLALLGRGVLALLLGAEPQRNAAYWVFYSVSQPLLRLARWLSPRLVLDRHVPLVAFVLLALLWLLLTVLKIGLCLRLGVALCR